MKIGIIGSGNVAQTIAGGLVGHGHEVVLGSRDPAKLADFTAAHPGSRAATVPEAAAFGELIVLAVKGIGASDALRSAGAENLSGKTILDATNPIDESRMPENGVVFLFTAQNTSLMETLQAEHPEARFVKALNSVCFPAMVNPKFADDGGRPSMFVCGNDDSAKAQVVGILDQFGWDAEDLGGAQAARAIEPLVIALCLPGFLRNDWYHAYKVLRP